MKPRTKLHFEILGLSKQLIDIENEMLKWAKVDCLEHIGFMTKSRVICMDCGGRFSPELVSRKRAVCPHCSTKLKVDKSKCTTHKQHIFIARAQVFGEYQVVRHFEIFSYHHADKPTKYYCQEIIQHWIKPNQATKMVGLQHNLTGYVDSWSGRMEIREENYRSYYGSKYDVYHSAIHPKSVFKPEFKKVGIDSNLRGLTILEAIRNIPMSSYSETLVKCKQYDLLYMFKGSSIHPYWSAIKICIRNKYIVKDAKLWVDYIDLLRYFNKDLHNAFYVCPKNLKQAHDKLVAKKREIQKRQSLEKQRTKIIDAQEAYERDKQQFFGIQFKKGNLTVKVLEHVKEFMEEGDTLHHCVFTNEYYKKPDSLVLSARIKEKPIETVEISLAEMKIIQSRGLQNKATEYHDDIIKLVESNFNVISSRMSLAM